jgi:hypothetical protein
MTKEQCESCEFLIAAYKGSEIHRFKCTNVEVSNSFFNDGSYPRFGDSRYRGLECPKYQKKEVKE